MARIVLLMAQPANSRLLESWLSEYHSVGKHPPGEPLEETCDLCIVDGAAMRASLLEIQRRREEERPGIFPVLLLTSRRNLWSRAAGIWQYVDDAVSLPVSKTELRARIEILLRARHLSLELKVRNEDLDAFIQAMSHDLRASLRAVTMFADAVGEKSGRLDEQGRQDLQRIHDVAGEMREQIDALLNFSRLGRGEIRAEPINLRSYIDSCLRNLQAEIRVRHANVKLKTRAPVVHADPTLLKIALTNLLSNAIKFVPDGVRPQITISADVRSGLCRIRVNDNGIGIAAADHQRIFEPFVRLHHESEFPGIGLGLPSVRKALELMGGRVGVDSNPGEGSTFWIEFPP